MAVADARLRAALSGTVLRPAWVALAVAAVPFALGADPPAVVQYGPLVVSGVLFGMPHGAVDHLVPARLADVDVWRGALAVGLLYLVAGGLYLGAWFLAPVAAAVSFVALTWFHWGQGDLYLLVALTDGDYPRSLAHRGAVVLVRGAMPMAVPLLAFPGRYRAVLADFVGLFDADLGAATVLFDPGTRGLLAIALVGLSVGSLARGAVADGGVALDRAVAVDAVETALLWAYFLVVPPVVAIGLYFCLWHALRHVARLVLVDDPAASALAGGDHRGALVRFARDAAPLTAVALAMVGGLWLVVPDPPTGVGEGVALYLVLIAVLTLPHVVVVTWMDHRQGVWTPADPEPSVGD
jgi:Brp/Blh family beta-carotene 15,15'-monooxygenase